MTRSIVSTTERVRVGRSVQADPALAVDDGSPLQVDGWDLIEPVYEGPLARTYRAQPTGSLTGRPAAYALKLLLRRWRADSRAIALFEREALVGQTVSHRHLVSVLAASVHRPPYYLVTPWLEGRTLAERLKHRLPLELPEALWIARQTAQAMLGLATAGWTHGDIKPENIFISPEGHVTLLDLGFARRRRETGSVANRYVMGTCQYLAPEAITSTSSVGVLGDIYSLGAVLYEMLAGRPPFESTDLAKLATKHRQDRVLDLRRLVPHLPNDVTRLVTQMLAKQPLRRVQTSKDLVERLMALEIATFAERSV